MRRTVNYLSESESEVMQNHTHYENIILVLSQVPHASATLAARSEFKDGTARSKILTAPPSTGIWTHVD